MELGTGTPGAGGWGVGPLFPGESQNGTIVATYWGTRGYGGDMRKTGRIGAFRKPLLKLRNINGLYDAHGTNKAAPRHLQGSSTGGWGLGAKGVDYGKEGVCE